MWREFKVANEEKRTSSDKDEALVDNDNKQPRSIRFYIEDPAGELYLAEASTDITIKDLATDFFVERGWPVRNSIGHPQRAVVERVDPNQSETSERLPSDATLGDTGVTNETTLRILPESVAGCFLGDVKVSLANGERKLISDVNIGDVVLSFDPKADIFSSAVVTSVYTGITKDYLLVNEMLSVTKDHVLWSNEGWIRAEDLKVGHFLLDSSKEPRRVNSIKMCSGLFRIYNLHVFSVEHTFFANELLVHNATLKAVDLSLLEVQNLEAMLDQIPRHLQVRVLLSKINEISRFSAIDRDHIQKLEQTIKLLEKKVEMLEKKLGLSDYSIDESRIKFRDAQ
jgi:hypothetical protein